MLKVIRNGIKTIIIALITTIRPLLGPAVCRFPVGCTQYAVEQLQSKSLLSALWNIIKRLLACNPFSGAFKQ